MKYCVWNEKAMAIELMLDDDEIAEFFTKSINDDGSETISIAEEDQNKLLDLVYETIGPDRDNVDFRLPVIIDIIVTYDDETILFITDIFKTGYLNNYLVNGGRISPSVEVAEENAKKFYEIRFASMRSTLLAMPSLSNCSAIKESYLVKNKDGYSVIVNKDAESKIKEIAEEYSSDIKEISEHRLTYFKEHNCIVVSKDAVQKLAGL